MNTIDKRNILNDMSVRLAALEDVTERDFSGGIQSYVSAIRELKQWKEAIERGEYDIKVWED